MPADCDVPAPTVSVVLPTLNERTHIRDCLDSLMAQDYASLVEILVIDGGSADTTGQIVARLASEPGSPVRALHNPRVSAAAAMNVGVTEAKGDIVCRADAHTLYARDYLRRCVEVLRETGADNVGGRMRPVGTTSFGRAVAAATSCRFGIGAGAFHYLGRRADVDTVYLGCWWKTTLQALGGFDESALQWAAEDQELNFRLRRRGGRIVLDPGIHSWYFPRETPAALARQYFNYGMAKASTLAKHGTLPSLRPLAPAVLVAAAASTLLLRRGWRSVALPAAHAAACGVVALSLGRQPGVAPHRALAALEICHWSYGFGFWVGCDRMMRGKGFDNRACQPDPAPGGGA